MLLILRSLALSLFIFPALASSDAITSHGIAMHGDLKYSAGFDHFEYVNPDAPKGGKARLASIGTYDSLNPYILKGTAAAGIGMLFDTLTVHSQDEAFSEYGLLAETITVPKDRSWVEYSLRAEARFHDGSPVTVEDVIYTLNTLKTKGHPFYRSYYGSVETAEKTGDRRVKFSFSSGDNRELPLIMGQMPVLSKAWWSANNFAKTTLKFPLGNGPYEVAKVDPGRSITYQRRKDYWGKDLAVNKGRHNFDQIHYDYYRDATVALEAFKSGNIDFREENTSKTWATAYDFPAINDGRVIKQEIPNERPTGMQGYVINTRRDNFKDPKVRQALALLFDFEWTNKNLFYGAYTRTNSYFSNSELASSGLPSAAELAILEPYRAQLPAEVFNTAYVAPQTDGSGRIRNNLRQALRLFKQAGWGINNKRLTHAQTGKTFELEFLLVNPAFERITLPYVRNLKRAGIIAKVRTVDSTQYQKRLENFEFDLTIGSFGQSLSPGNEQRNFWTQKSAQTPGSRNTAGVSNPAIDALVEQVISATNRQDLINKTRALDRALLWGHYVIPQWHIRSYRVAYWKKFQRPKVSPKYALGFNNWWIIPTP